MTEFRRDPLTHRWIITGFAKNNPEELIPVDLKKSSGVCPFCPGNEYLTPPENYAVRTKGQANEPGWEIRVTPNRATDMSVVDLQKRPQGSVYDLQNASGLHETIIESPSHISRFSQLEIPAIISLLNTFQKRCWEHRKNHQVKSLLIFRNQGKGCAGTYEHAHSQMISVPFVFKAIENELNGAKKFFEQKNRCIFCDMYREENTIQDRLVFQKGDYIAWTPFASRFPFEVWILGQPHQSQFTQAEPKTFEDLAHVLKTVLTKIETTLGDTPISFVLHSAPLRFETEEEIALSDQAYHWHIEILPHAFPAGGFEWGGDFFLSPPTPEACAKILRDQKIL